MLYDKNGRETTNRDEAWLEIGKNNFVRCSHGRLINPEDLVRGHESWFKVSKDVADLYLRFLKTKKMVLLRSAQRLL